MFSPRRKKAVALGRRTFLKEDPFQQRILVPQHETLVGRLPVALLQVLQRLLMKLDCILELLDVLGPSLSESGLRLSVPLFALLRCCVDLSAFSCQRAWSRHGVMRCGGSLICVQHLERYGEDMGGRDYAHRFTSTLPLLLLGMLLRLGLRLRLPILLGRGGGRRARSI
jgi:hypothetical protein